MRKGLWLGLGVVTLGVVVSATLAPKREALAEDKAAGSVVCGKVLWDGAIPEPRKLEVNKDNDKCECNAKDPSLKQPFKLDESLTVDAGTKGVANCVVWLKGATGGPAITDTQIDQKGCQFVPHVALVTTGQKVKVLNPDGISHNFHWWSTLNPPDNKTMQKFKKSMDIPEAGFSKPEFIRVTCDIHSWMGGWIAVMENGYAARTDDKGAFTIQGVPPGKYTLACWHEPLGPEGKPFLLEQSVVVEAGKPASADFTLSAK